MYAIGLRTKDLDADALRRLARATGGGYTEAGAEHEIVDRFQATAQQLRRSFYRLVVLPATPATSANLPIDVTVGGESGVTISSRIPGT